MQYSIGQFIHVSDLQLLEGASLPVEHLDNHQQGRLLVNTGQMQQKKKNNNNEYENEAADTNNNDH